jgi:hypothetical protein
LGVHETLDSLLSTTNDGKDPPVDAIIAVDWTGMAGVRLFLMANKGRLGAQYSMPTFFLNFRVYSRMTDTIKLSIFKLNRML